MSMSTHVVGFCPADAKFKKMKAVYDACTEAKTTVPDEVQAFFNHEEPDDAGVVVDLEASMDSPVAKWSDDYRAGLEVDITKLPKHVRIVRFYNSW